MSRLFNILKTMAQNLISLNSKTLNLITTQSFSSNTTDIAPNGVATIQIDCAKDGYTPIGVKHLQNNVGGSVVVNGYWWSGTTLFINNKNITSLTASSVQVVCTITYAKTAVM